MKRMERADVIVGICNDVLLKGTQPSLPELSASEWEQTLEEASTQGVLPVVIGGIDNGQTASSTKMGEQLLQWIGELLRNEQNYRMRLYVMRELATLFGKEGLDILFLKGASLAQLYPKPEWRVCSDVDYYLFGESERGIKLLAEQGIENSEYYHHHTQASLNGVLLENHYDFVERVNHKCDIILDDALKALAEKEGRSLQAEFLGEKIANAYLMTPTMNAIFLMRHMSAHFVGETIPLRQLYDWALFLKKYAGEVDWGYVMPLYKQSGMMRFAGIIMAILRTHLEFECKACPIVLGKQPDSERVWESIVNPPEPDPYDKFTLRYYLFETKTFFANRWKHKIVYPGESFVRLFFKYAWHAVKKMTGVLKH